MILTTHAVIGAGIATLVPQNPALGVGVAFASHFLLDAIPHWDYQLNSRYEDHSDLKNDDMLLGRAFVGDLFKIGLDFVIGLALAWLILTWLKPEISLVTILLGVLGGMAPDFLQFAYFKLKREPLTSLQRFHQWIHTSWRLKNKPIVGLGLQALLVTTFLVLVL